MSGKHVQMQLNTRELYGLLRDLPAHLTHEAETIIMAQSEYFARDVVAGYPLGSEGRTRKGVPITPGSLKRGVKLALHPGRFSARGTVRNRAPHAWIFDHGTRARRTKKGWKRGASSAADAREAFVPKAVRARKRMEAALIALVEKAGAGRHSCIRSTRLRGNTVSTVIK